MDSDSDSEGNTAIRGKIKSIFCKNFITFKEVTFEPNLFLNIVCGPNGSGKSSIVSAIVLGLGGEPKALARASNIVDYIKNGQATATIRVTLYADDEAHEIVFERRIHRKGPSEFRVGLEVVSHKQYLAKIAEYRVQITNLCQFLPQDRVQEFARMNAQEILQNTMSSVCHEDMLRRFEKLKELRDQQLNAGSSKTSIGKDLEQNTFRLEELKKMLECYEIRNEFMAKVKMCNIKRLWLECEEAKTRATELANDMKMAKENVTKHKNLLAELEKQKTQYETQSRKLKKNAEEKKTKFEKLSQRIMVATEKIADLKSQIPQHKSSFERKKQDLNQEQRGRDNQQVVMDSAKQELDNFTTELTNDYSEGTRNAWDHRLKEFKRSVDQRTREVSKIKTELEEHYTPEIGMLKTKIERCGNVQAQKLQMLQNRANDVYKAHHWLNSNRERFAGKVYDPIILEVNVCNPQYAKYFENVIKMADMLAIVCEEKADVSLITEELSVKQKLNVTIAYGATNEETTYAPNEPLQNLKRFGFTHYLMDLIDGPPVVLNYLCSLYNLHNIPIGGAKVSRCTDQIPSSLRFYFSDDQLFMINTSKYSGLKSTLRTVIQGKNLLLSVNKNEMATLTERLKTLVKSSDQLKNKRTALEAELQEIEFQRKQLLQEKRAYDAKLLKLREYTENYKRQRQKYDSMVKSMISLDQLENDYTTSMSGMLKELLLFQQNRLNQMRQCVTAQYEMQLAAEMSSLYEDECEIMVNLRKQTDELAKASTTFARVEVIYAKEKKTFKAKEAEALAMSSDMRPTDNGFPHADVYAELPNDLQTLKDQISECTARLDCMENVDQNIVEEFHERQAEVERLTKQMHDNVTAESNCLEEICKHYNIFFPELCEIVENISFYFSKFMESLNYVGEVSIQKNEDYDFDSYGIKIMVQYHKDQPLQVLDRFVLSGGERAVAIAIYTLSLQNLTYVPFRCVDEINQGMDANNEARVFKMLVRETTKNNRAQFFFVTPKPLSTVVFNERVTAHVVFNSDFLSDVNKYN